MVKAKNEKRISTNINEKEQVQKWKIILFVVLRNLFHIISRVLRSVIYIK